ncbi:MAG: hypothetical protein JSR39_01085 [Verrucomicrobia bacterium]|nr:hypothetical protein [Verrucomicrobiota bacterium]
MLYLSELLPYELDSKKNGSLRSSLKEYQALINAATQAVQAVHNRDYQKFDSLVGENACEIRAIWLCQLVSSISQNINCLERDLLEVLNRLEGLLEHSSLDALMRSEQTFQTIVQSNNLQISVSYNELILIVSFLLSEMKAVKCSNESIPTIFRVENAAPKNLKRYGDVSTSFALNLISKLRKTLAAASVQFVREKAFALQDADLIAKVSDEFTFVHNALPCIPMFWTYKTLLSTAQQESIPLVIYAKFLEKNGEEYSLVDEEKLFYAVGRDGAYRQVQPTAADLEKPACIIQGIAVVDRNSWSKSEWKARMSEKSVIDVVLAGAADHRQYPDAALDSLFDDVEDRAYSAYKQHALNEGFAVENPSTFFIQHVYAALTGNLITHAPIAKQPMGLHFLRGIFARELELVEASL